MASYKIKFISLVLILNLAFMLTGANEAFAGRLFASSASGGGATDIGDSIASGTANSILYIDASGNLAEKNPGLTWDETTMNVISQVDAADTEGFRLQGPERATAATGDSIYMSMYLENNADADVEAGRITAEWDNILGPNSKMDFHLLRSGSAIQKAQINQQGLTVYEDTSSNSARIQMDSEGSAYFDVDRGGTTSSRLAAFRFMTAGAIKYNLGFMDSTNNLLLTDGTNTFLTVVDDGTTATATFNSIVEVADDAYAAGWNGSVEVATKNALYDKIETLAAGSSKWTDAGAYLHPNTDGDGWRLKNAGDTIYVEIKDTVGNGFILDTTDTFEVQTSGGMILDAATNITYSAGTSGSHALYTDNEEMLSIRGHTTFDQLVFDIHGNAGLQLVIGGVTNQDYDHAAATDPVVYVHSITSPDTANDEWWSISHNQTNAVYARGSGTHTFDADIDVTGDVGGTTIGGITEANLLDKSATETVSGAWTYSTSVNISGGDFELPQASPAAPDADGEAELDMTDGKFVIQNSSGHAALGAATDAVYGSLIKNACVTLLEPDKVQAVIDNVPMMGVESTAFPHGIEITNVYLKTDASSSLSIVLEKWATPTDGAPDTLTTLATSASTEATEAPDTDGTVGTSEIIMIDLDTTDVNWAEVCIEYYEPIA